MRQTPKVEGTKIAQAAKDLNVTSVTIRRYLTEFNIETTADDNGIKVLPNVALEELKEVRRLKEEGLTNPRVMELLEELRARYSGGADMTSQVPAISTRSKTKAIESLDDSEDDQITKKVSKRPTIKRDEASLSTEEAETVDSDSEAGEAPSSEESEAEAAGDTRPKHSLTCQTCSKVFEHMNPRLRDCLDCYRTKRKERRRGGSERHKNVIQHPLAQQAANKTVQNGNGSATASLVAVSPNGGQTENYVAQPAAPLQTQAPPLIVPAAYIQRGGPVRNYRKAIEETRQITGSLKRRLERPDLPEGERRWLEQIYAYQLILHQGWRHLSDYTSATQQQNKTPE
jgi:DNA-binding transcriptional MerR regulator